MSKVLCFGELLMRLSPHLGGEWLHHGTMPVYIGGAELNCATALSRWQVPVSYCTALPNHYLSHEIVAYVQERGIDTNAIQWSGNRIGCYYLPQGADLKHAGVIYDRAHSSFWDLQPGQINWDEVFKDVSWFHFSAISPALNQHVANVCLEAVKAAAGRGITVSVDLNHRDRLWQYGKKPVEIMPELVNYCHVVMGNIWSEEIMLGITVDENLPDEKEAYISQSLRTAQQMVQQFKSCRQVANTFRFDDGNGVKYFATLYTGDRLFTAREQHTQSVIDKVGTGDTFMAGLIYGNRRQWAPQQIIDFAAAAAFQKLFVKGDATTSTVEEIQKSFSIYA